MPSDSLASTIFQSIKAAPAPGLEMLFALVEAGRVSFDEPMHPGGPGLLDALFHHVLHEGPINARMSGTLFQKLFSPAHVDRFLSLSNGTAFARRDAEGAWIPLAFLSTLATATLTSNGSPRKNMPPIPEKGALDKWLSAVIPTLPNDALEQEGPRLLAEAFKSDLLSSASMLWRHVDPLAVVDNLPVICCARRAEAWDRFVSDGMDVNSPVHGKPLWKFVLDRVSPDKPAPNFSFLGGFERWFLDRAPHDDEMKMSLNALIMGRARRPAKTGAGHWLAMFQAAGTDSLRWPCPAVEDCELWEVAALAQPGQAFFNQLPQYPRIVAAIDPDHLAHVHVLTMVRDIASDQVQTIKSGLDLLTQTVSAAGWPVMGSPWVQSFCRLPLDSLTRTRLLNLAKLDDDAWWGHADQRDALGRRLFFMIPKLLEKSKDTPIVQSHRPGRSNSHLKERLMSWQVLTDAEFSNAWIDVGRGIASALCNKLDGLHAVPRESICVVAKDPHGLAVLELLTKSVASTHQKNYLSWLESVRMEAQAPEPGYHRASPRL